MSHSAILGAATRILADLEAQNRTVAYNNGHFRELVRRATPVLISEDQNDRINTELETLIINSANRTKPNGEDFAVQLNDLADVYIKPMTSRINTLRHRLIPFILDLVSHVEQTYTEAITLTPEIREVPVSPLYTNGSVFQLTKRHGELGIFGTKNIDIMGGFNDRNEDEILALLKSGSTVFNDTLLDMVATHPNGWVKEVYDRYFLKGEAIPASLSHNNYLAYLDEAIIVYLILGNMVNQEIVDSGINLSYENYFKRLTNDYALVGGFLHRYTARLATIVGDKELVQHWDRDNNVIYVYKPVWDDFITQRGDVDALLGALYTTGPRVFVHNLLTNGPRLAETWNKTYETLLKEREIKFVSDVRAILGKALMEKLPKQESKLLALFAADLSSPVDVLNIDHTHYTEITNMILRNYDQVASKNVYLSISNAVLNCKFISEQGFKQLYFAIDRKVEEANKNDISLSPANAAFLVMLEEVTRAVLRGSFQVLPKV